MIELRIFLEKPDEILAAFSGIEIYGLYK